MGDVLMFARAMARADDWSEQERADLLRLYQEFAGRGMNLETASGVSDNGDPWFAICQPESGDVLAHVARIDGDFVLHRTAVVGSTRNRNFRKLLGDAFAPYQSATAHRR